MAKRPVFIPSVKRGTLYETALIEFDWSPGFSISQKRKNIAALHKAARLKGMYPLLEISTKSEEELGRRLSAFNLKLQVGEHKYYLESVYQSSKVFSLSGQHIELINLSPIEAKRLAREKGKGEIKEFRFMGIEYASEPKNAFYDWLYLRAISPHSEWISNHVDFFGYTDIEFNPEKSINCQARAVAEFMSLVIQGRPYEYVDDFWGFRELLSLAQRRGDDIL